MILLVIYVSILFAIPFAVFHRIPNPWLRPIGFGILWALIEYLRTLGYFSFAWGFLGHSVYETSLMAITAILPIPIISGIIAALNIYWLFLLQYVLSKTKVWKLKLAKQIAVIGFLWILLIGPALFAVEFMVSSFFEEQFEANTSRPLKVALLQGNFSMEPQGQNDKRSAIDTYLDLATQAVKQDPELIILPESAFSYPLNYSSTIIDRISVFVDEHNVEMLIGGVHGHYIGNGSWDFWNRAYLFSPGQQWDTSDEPVMFVGMQTYDKMHLVPYGEWIPGGNLPIFSWIETLIEEAGAGIFQRGNTQTIFELKNGMKFAVAICFESTLSGKMKNAKQLGADFLVNITNDAWFKRSPGLPQHFMQSAFRAAENNCYLLRCANTGITAIIDPNGKIQKRIPDNKTGFLVDTIYIPNEK